MTLAETGWVTLCVERGAWFGLSGLPLCFSGWRGQGLDGVGVPRGVTSSVRDLFSGVLLRFPLACWVDG